MQNNILIELSKTEHQNNPQILDTIMKVMFPNLIEEDNKRSQRLVEDILNNLMMTKGLSDEFDMLDKEQQEEIKQKWIEISNYHLYGKIK